MKIRQMAATGRGLRTAIHLALLLVLPLGAFTGPTSTPRYMAPAAEHVVLITGSGFVNQDPGTSPGDPLSIATGDTVTWANHDASSHDVAILDGPQLNISPELTQGQEWSMTFTRPGKYHYTCELHPSESGDIVVGGSTGTANPDTVLQTFKETGKTVRGTFLAYWQDHGGLAQQGYPISEEMQEKSDTDGKVYTVQYFERAAFEYHPENQPPNDVLLSLLGVFRYKQKYPAGAPGQQPDNSPVARLFEQTGKRLGGVFLDYWQAHGGLAQQGFPISDEFQEKSDLDGKTYLVQYFERAVFEYHPENQPPYDVLLSQIGKFRYDEVLARQQPPGLPAGIKQVGLSSGPEHYPLLAGPHAAPGLNIWIYDQDPSQVVTWMDDLGTKWAMHQLAWADIEQQRGVYNWSKIDGAVDALYKAGVRIILNPVHFPVWLWGADSIAYPQDQSDFGHFMQEVARRYKGKVVGYQIWNEPNMAKEMGGDVAAARYAPLLEAGYKAVKSVDPNAVVISGALTPNGVHDPSGAVDDVEFLKRMYAYNGGELKGYFDVLGAHPGSNANPPDTLYPDNPGPGPGWNNHASFYFRRVEQIRQVMVENGDAQKQIWLTEFGWASTTRPAKGFEYATQTSEAQQASYIGEAFRMGRDQYPWMGPMILFQLNMALPSISPSETDERIAWGIIRRDGSKRPSYFAVQQYAKEYNTANK